MKAEPKKAPKITKNRLICITLPESLLASAKSYRRKTGFNSMSELLRATIEHATAAAMKRNAPEPRVQISFRLTDALYGTLVRASNQSGQSIARIIRTLLENAPKIGILPPGAPAKRRKIAAKKSAKNSAKSAPAKSVPAKSVPAKKSSKKSAAVPAAGTKSAGTKKSAAAGTKSAAKNSSKKSAPAAAKRRSR